MSFPETWDLNLKKVNIFFSAQKWLSYMCHATLVESKVGLSWFILQDGHPFCWDLMGIKNIPLVRIPNMGWKTINHTPSFDSGTYGVRFHPVYQTLLGQIWKTDSKTNIYWNWLGIYPLNLWIKHGLSRNPRKKTRNLEVYVRIIEPNEAFHEPAMFDVPSGHSLWEAMWCVQASLKMNPVYGRPCGIPGLVNKQLKLLNMGHKNRDFYLLIAWWFGP